MFTNLKQELIDKISATEDEDLLLLLKTDFDYFTRQDNIDVTDQLSQFDRDELVNLVKEPFGNDTISQKELDEAIRQWRIR